MPGASLRDIADVLDVNRQYVHQIVQERAKADMTTGQIILAVIGVMLTVGTINGWLVKRYERRKRRRVIFDREDWPI